MKKLKEIFKNMLFFNEPEQVEEFILKENNNESDRKTKQQESLSKKIISTIISNDENNNKWTISKKLSENLEYIKKIYNVPTNGDLIIREFDIVIKKDVVKAFIVFFDGMTDRKVINDNILEPLMILSNIDIKNEDKIITDYIKNHILPHNQLNEQKDIKKVIDEINFGGCGLFIDGIDSAFAADVKGWEHRNVEKPTTELVIRGPQEGFNEVIRVNTALIRKRMKDENLIVENIEIGEKSKTPCAMMYIKNLANESLVQEVRRRLKSIKVDYLNDSGELEQFIEDNTFLPSPQIVATERPDRVSAMLAEGRIAVVVNGSPFVLVVPITFYELLHSPEDNYIRYPYANLFRIIRMIGIVFSLLLPGIYIAITNFHHELIPTDLLLAIEASREKVPFPSILEILIMEFSFELIREAGVRIPGAIGPTLGIIGALILGQAAVAANIVSPILIIVVAVTGIGSFAIPSFSLAFSFRVLRFGYIFLGGIAGFLGITTGLFIHGLVLASAKSFGVPFLAPFAPKTAGGSSDEIYRGPIWKQEDRPEYINPKDEKMQPKISRGWTKKGFWGNKNGEK